MDFREQINYLVEDSQGQFFIDPLYYAISKYLNVFTPNVMQTFIVQGNIVSTLPYLSFLLYGTKDYWWLLGLLNGINNALVSLPVGTIINYPTINAINQYKSALTEISGSSNSNLNPLYIGGNVAL